MSNAGLPPQGLLPPGAAVPPQRQSQAALWIAVILGCCVAAAIVAGLLMVRLIVHRVKIREAGNKVAIETPVGSINVNKAGAHATGLPVYPGATLSGDNGGSVELSGRDANVGLATEEYRTGDPVAQVQAWYRQRLGSEFHLETGGTSRERRTKLHIDASDHEMAFVDDRNDGARIVALDNGDGGTKITLVRVGKRDTQ
jgi:hypothetical protein